MNRKQKLKEQRVIGLLMIAISVALIVLCSKGATLADRDASAILLIAPLGLYLMFTKRLWII